ncbi:MAG: DNA polymerase Y family protein [Candidatus Sulfotelmatobacter sp.]
MTTMMRPAELYALLYVSEFSMKALLRIRSWLRDTPCAVLDGDSPLQKVYSLNMKAQLLGVSHNMTRLELDEFHSVTVLTRSHKEEEATKSALRECVSAFSPRAEEKNEDNAFSCVIDLMGTEKLHGSPETLSYDLLARVRSLGLQARIVISRNIHAAALVVKGMPSHISLKSIPAGEESAALTMLPITVLNLTEEQEETFSLWGIRTLGSLADLPEDELIARMGQSGKQLHQLARGEMPHLFQPSEPAFALEECMDLDTPLVLLHPLLFVMNRMLEQLIQRAKSRVLALASITVTLILEGAATHSCTVRPALPTNDKQLWVKLLQLELEAHPPKASVLALTLAAEPGSTSKAQRGLFAPQIPEPARLDITLARIRAIVGEENVGRAVLTDSHQTQGFQVAPFTPALDSASCTSPKRSRSAVRKLCPMETIALKVQDTRPKTLLFRDRLYIVKDAYGPWLISGDWWNQSGWTVEQWDLIAQSQESGRLLCCCVMRDPIQDCWQMAALYD